jgi:triosephosphate isomerase
MHQNHYEAIQFMQKLAYLVGKDDFDAVDVSVHPPFTDIRSVQTLIEGDDLRFLLGAQHCHFDDKGAFTGEVAPSFLSKLNVKYVICGHSERREIFGESDEMVKSKVKAILANSMTPIVCVGETLEEREAGSTTVKVLGQIRSALSSLTPEQVGSLVVAYEPIWAIGTGKTATTEDAHDVCCAMRREVSVLYGAEAASTPPGWPAKADPAVLAHLPQRGTPHRPTSFGAERARDLGAQRRCHQARHVGCEFPAKALLLRAEGGIHACALRRAQPDLALTRRICAAS